jgi:hypothetical protein
LLAQSKAGHAEKGTFIHLCRENVACDTCKSARMQIALERFCPFAGELWLQAKKTTNIDLIVCDSRQTDIPVCGQVHFNVGAKIEP